MLLHELISLLSWTSQWSWGCRINQLNKYLTCPIQVVSLTCFSDRCEFVSTFGNVYNYGLAPGCHSNQLWAFKCSLHCQSRLGETADWNAGLKESATLEPTNPYSAAKAGAEMMAKAYLTSYKLPVITTRGNNVDFLSLHPPFNKGNNSGNRVKILIPYYSFFDGMSNLTTRAQSILKSQSTAILFHKISLLTQIFFPDFVIVNSAWTTEHDIAGWRLRCCAGIWHAKACFSYPDLSVSDLLWQLSLVIWGIFFSYVALYRYMVLNSSLKSSYPSLLYWQARARHYQYMEMVSSDYSFYLKLPFIKFPNAATFIPLVMFRMIWLLELHS